MAFPTPNRILTTLDAPRLASHTADGLWRTETIYSIVASHAASAPQRIAIRERTQSFSFSELVAASERVASDLHDHGVRAGDRVAVWLPSRAEVAAVVLACSRNGFIACPSLHRDHTVAEVAELVRRMGAAAVVYQRGYGADADRQDLATADLGDDRAPLLIPLEAKGDGTRELFAGTSQPQPGPCNDDPNSVVYLAFTSGTTGLPKGVMHSDNTLLAPTRAIANDWSLDESSVIYSLSPLSHNLGFGAMLLSLSIGAQFVVHDLPRGASLAARLRETAATFAFGVPTHAIDLLEELKTQTALTPPPLRGFRISGAAVPSVVAQGLLDIGIVPQSGYGMTEAGSHHYTLADDTPEMIVGTSGRACASYQVRIVDRDNPEHELPAGEVGQIVGRGASLMLGYFDDQRATETSFTRSGWFMTGDLGWQDADGYLRITGRKKEVIIRGGHNIFPAKIESLALQHPDVTRAAAVPVHDDRLGEKVCLVVQANGSALEPNQFLTHLDDAGLSRYDMPEYFCDVEELPLTASGKVLKRRVIEWIADGTITVHPVRFVPTTSAEK